MEFQFRSPRNPLEWVVSVLAIGVVIALGVVLSAVAIVAIGATLLIAPVVGWWRRRGRPPGAPPAPPAAPGRGRVVDVEFEVEEKE